MTVVITGAAGFLGSHLAKHYLLAGEHVIGIDDYSSSRRDSEHLYQLKQDQHFRLVEGSIEDRVTFENAGKLVTSNLSAVLNFACPASPPIYQKMPIKTMLTCVAGTANALEFAKSAGARFVQASTSEVYGDPDHSPQEESYRGNVNCWGDRANYDVGKRAAETLCYEYLKSGTKVRAVRIFNTYGENMDPNDGRVITNFVKQALSNSDITIYGDGTQTRSFCYVSDLISAITIAEGLQHNPSTPINIGNPVEYTIKELAEIIIELTGSSSKIKFVDLPSDDPKQRRPNITLAKHVLSWQPTVDLRTGLQKMIAYMKKVV